MKKILAVAALLFVSNSWAWTQTNPLDPKVCQSVIAQPTSLRSDTTLICRQGYFTLHDNQAKIPVWTAWTVSPKTVNGCWPRTNAFVADKSLPADKRADPKDYAGSGYDQGHLANDAHQSWDQQVEYESFLMTNMAPQKPGLNRGIWKLLESATGAWAYNRGHTLTVYAGSVYDVEKDKKIGAGKVVVPSGFWKIVVDNDTREVLAFYFPHREDLGSDLSKVQVTVADVEQTSGIVFLVPGDKKVKAKLWDISYKEVAANKKAVCKR
jgi:endonuclease G